MRLSLQSKYKVQFERFQYNNSITIQEIVEAFAVVVDETKEILQLMIGNHLENIIVDEITKCISLFAVKFVKEDNKNRLP